MKAVMSDRVKRYLSNNKTKQELMLALDLLHKNKGESTQVEIGGEILIIKYALKDI